MSRAGPTTARALLVWAALLLLLAATVGGAFLPIPGAARAGLAFGIALAKAGLVFWFFMDGRELTGLVRLAAVAGLLWIAVMLALTGADYATRRPADGATFVSEADRNRRSEVGLPP